MGGARRRPLGEGAGAWGPLAVGAGMGPLPDDGEVLAETGVSVRVLLLAAGTGLASDGVLAGTGAVGRCPGPHPTPDVPLAPTLDHLF